MATPTASSYTSTSGVAMFCGRIRPFDSVSVASQGGGVLDSSDNGKVLVVELHGSSGQNYTSGTQYWADVSGLMAYDTYNVFKFHPVKSVQSGIFLLRPNDEYGIYPGNSAKRESHWLGFRHIPGDDVTLITQRRLEALMEWADENLTQEAPRKRCLRGGSMGGWGTLTFGVRRRHIFAALYADRPRWRYNATIGNVSHADYTGVSTSVPWASAPILSAADGGLPMTTIQDITTYISDTDNKIPWIGWCVGRNDGFVQFQDHVDAVAAMRAAKRGFAFAWNDGNHTTGSIMSQIEQSYYYGTFEIGKGYPLFTNHSGDQDPAVDITGGINIGLSFRNVVESADSWSCEVTSVLGERTVDVEPISDVFTTTVTPQTANIPSANTWVSVSFSA